MIRKPRRPRRPTPEQIRQYDFQDGIHMNGTDNGGTIFMTMKAAAIYFNCHKKTIKRYVAQKLFNIYRAEGNGRGMGIVWLIVDSDFHRSGVDILENKKGK